MKSIRSLIVFKADNTVDIITKSNKVIGTTFEKYIKHISQKGIIHQYRILDLRFRRSSIRTVSI